MKPLKYLLLFFAVGALTNFVDAADGIHVRSGGFRFDMVPVDPNATSSGPIAAADCVVRVQKKQALLHWATSPFVHVSNPELTSDAFLAATVTSQNGKIAVSPRRVIDRTNLSGGDDTAAIAMGVQGNGKAEIKLEVGIDEQGAAAGLHQTTVILTVTSQ